MDIPSTGILDRFTKFGQPWPCHWLDCEESPHPQLPDGDWEDCL